MELFIPSLLVLVLAAVVVFIMMPKMSPYVLGVMALIFLVVGVYQHYSMFPYEYSMANSLEALKDYSGFILIGVTIVGLLIIMGWSFGISPPSIESVIPTGSEVTSTVNSTMNSVLGRPANNKGSTLLGLGGNNTAKRNNVASTNFKVV
jgi:uncharacterized membrane protein